jgi:hypothetical protein
MARMERPPIFKVRMTKAQYQRRWRAKVRKRKLLAPEIAKQAAKRRRRDEREKALRA